VLTPKTGDDMELTKRKKEILKVVVEDYVETAEPVGSKAIAQQMGGSVSSATVRNELADLVEMGYLEQPHTSAGRVPSPKGYRLYVNELMEKRQLSQQETENIHDSLQVKMEQLDSAMSRAGQMVSSMVNYPAYVLASGKNSTVIKRFELLAVDVKSVIAVVMDSDDRVKSQLLHTQMPVETERLPAISALLNQEFVGISRQAMMQQLMSLSGNTPPAIFMLLNQVLDYAAAVLEESARKQVYTSGASQILKLPEYRDLDKAQQMMTFLSDQKDQLPVPEDNTPMQILIGPENVSTALQDSSVVMASYDIGDNMRGLIGVVGPTRMDYASVAARLSFFAESMSRMFGKRDQLPPKEDKK